MCWCADPQVLAELRDKTEASWTRERRAAVAKAVRWRSAASTKKRALEGCGEISDSFLKEARFQIEKAKKAKLQAISDNALLASEIHVGERQQADDMSQHQRTLDISRESQKLKTQKVLAREPVFSLRGMRCFVADDVDTDAGPLMAKHGLVPENDRNDAEIFVVGDPSCPGQRISWLAALKGLRVVTPIYMISGGRRGACLKYHRLRLNLEAPALGQQLWQTQHTLVKLSKHVCRHFAKVNAVSLRVQVQPKDACSCAYTTVAVDVAKIPRVSPCTCKHFGPCGGRSCL